jgi:hypothetical protein
VLLAVYLGCFSLGMLTPWRGLLLTSGGLLLVGTFMLLYARRAVAPEPEPVLEPAPEPAPGGDAADAEPGEGPALFVEEVSIPERLSQAPVPQQHAYCPHCARALEADYAFCPSCGRDTSALHRCASCGHQQLVPQDAGEMYCVRCGEPLG